jgi:hypothetical protein
MFQFILIMVIAGGQAAPRINPEVSFNTLQECADSIPDEYLKLIESVKWHPIAITLGCLKTGEKS